MDKSANRAVTTIVCDLYPGILATAIILATANIVPFLL